MIKIYEPYRISDSSDLVKVSIDSGRLTCFNSEFTLVKERLTELHGIPTIPVFNGTCATHLALKALKIKVPNLKNVIVPNNVYVAAWNSMLMDGDLNLIPVDADERTWCVDTSKLRDEIIKSDPRETGILVVHNVGGIVNVPSLMRDFPDHFFIEDNCEGFLGEYEGKKSGTASLASSISFYANKTITCGEGGALIIQPELHDIIYRTQSQGQTNTRYVHDILAYNYRMTNTQATILLGQMDLIPEIMEKKKILFETYRRLLSEKFQMQIPESGTKHSSWMFSVRAKGFDYHSSSKEFGEEFESRPMFYPMSSHLHLRKFARDEEVASKLARECFMLPSHPALEESDIVKVCNRLNKVAG
jgi:perosamine synthetase